MFGLFIEDLMTLEIVFLQGLRLLFNRAELICSRSLVGDTAERFFSVARKPHGNRLIYIYYKGVQLILFAMIINHP